MSDTPEKVFLYDYHLDFDEWVWTDEQDLTGYGSCQEYVKTDTIDHYKQALRDMVKVIDEMRYTIGREVKGKVMPKSQEMAYEVLKTHAPLIESLKDE